MAYNLKTEQFLPVSLEHAWDFFSSPDNLALITPPELRFKVLTSFSNKKIYEGMQIDYIVRPILGIPLKWKTEIGKVETGHFFSDVQLKGPYKLWRHTHTFILKDDGVLMKDEVEYELPLGILGKFAHWLFVKKKIEHIFEFRKNVLTGLFKKA